MVLAFEFFPDIEFTTKLILGTIITIIFLILAEILEVEHDPQDLKEILSPIITILIITFIFIIIKRISEILA